MIEEGNIITLGENHKYNVVFSTILNDENYIFLSNIDNIVDSCFYKVNGPNRLKLVKDNKIIDILLEKYKEKVNL